MTLTISRYGSDKLFVDRNVVMASEGGSVGEVGGGGSAVPGPVSGVSAVPAAGGEGAAKVVVMVMTTVMMVRLVMTENKYHPKWRE